MQMDSIKPFSTWLENAAFYTGPSRSRIPQTIAKLVLH